ncbi:MAG TPA: phytoene/squalene synthase family protein [Rubrobacteraceae bacterium]|nr:phytoene/squalene synthase family protein [Rubrobacteraceae bacterium]
MRLDPAGGKRLDAGLSLAESYELCRRAQRAHSKTYYFSTRLFPSEVRPHVHALYAFMRYADEIVDNPGATSLEEQLSALEAFEEETLAAVAGEEVPNPVLRAYANTVRVRGIDPEDIAAFMKSMKMDTNVFRYQTYEDLAVYTYGSAAVVGLMMCRVVGVADRRADVHAETLGVAMQLTNFLRDIGEDWRRGRVYIPLEDLERFGYGEADLGRGVVDERFVALLRFEIRRARRLYALADEGMGYIPRGRRYPVVVARELYAAILDRIEAQGYDVFARRAETSRLDKLGVAARCAARDPGELLAGRRRLPRRADVASASPS